MTYELEVQVITIDTCFTNVIVRIISGAVLVESIADSVLQKVIVRAFKARSCLGHVDTVGWHDDTCSINHEVS